MRDKQPLKAPVGASGGKAGVPGEGMKAITGGAMAGETFAGSDTCICPGSGSQRLSSQQ